MSFATQLRQLRTDLGLSQARAAELLGLSRGAIAYYEAGKREPPDEPIRSKQQILDDLKSRAQSL
jgi:transcriptional regulator with XRE-family HTH domain